MKNLKSIFLFAVLLLVGLSAGAYSFKVDGIYYDINSDQVTVSVTYREQCAHDVVIPSSVTYNGNTYSVTSIGNSAFYNCTSLTNVTIPNSVTSIGNYAFGECTSLTSITIPNSVTYIGEDAFFYCTSLTSITIPNSVTSIGGSAFSDCTSLTSITIPNSVTSIGNYAFGGCTSLTSITIPNSVTSIDEGAFRECTSLTNVSIPNSVTSIGNYAFMGCTSLTSVTIPNSITSIGVCAFSDCTSLTNVSIPNSVTSIGNYAFGGCTSLTSITIPNSITSIGVCAFSDCTSLTSINVDNDNNFYSSIDGVLFSKNQDTLICYPSGKQDEEYVIPNSVTSIGYSAFNSCTSLTSVSIPNSVTSISNYTFYKCTSLTNVTIGSSVTSIGEYAFNYCPLDTVICKGDVPATLDETRGNAFDYEENTVLIVPCGKKSVYKSAEGWRNFSNIVEDCENTGIEDVVNENNVEVYPNPAKEKLTIKAENEVSIFNNKGQIVKVIKNIKGTKEIDISDLQSGVYYIKTGDVTKKLIVE